MAVFFGSQSFFESSGNAAARFGEELRDAIVTHSCNIWRQFPVFVTGGRNPVSSFARGYMNGVCEAGGDTPPPIEKEVIGGQCPEVQYRVEIEYELALNGDRRTREVIVWGPVDGAKYNPLTGGTGWEVVVAARTAPPDNLPFEYVVDSGSAAGGFPQFLEILSIVRLDGNPDNCGNRPPQYPPETPPTQSDLSTTINITNIDGTSNEYSLTWNQTNNNYNFPFNFKLNGVNVTVDLGGVTIWGDVNVTTSNDGNESPPPGSDGGKDVDGNDYEEVFPDTEYPNLPVLVQPNLVEQVIEYLVCDLGVIQAAQGLVKLPPGYEIVWDLVFTVISAIIDEVCGQDSGEIGFPEVYPVLPGVDRPIIMYYYKEVIDGQKQPSTYVSTLPNPNTAAINEIDTVNVPNRVLGEFVASIKLNDGSRIVARGNTVTEAQAHFNFLISRTVSTNVPSDVPEHTVITQQPKLQTVDVQCVQIEYYPDGKSFGRTASVRRIIPV